MRPRKLLSCDKGQMLIFITLAFVLLGLLVGLAVDGGRGYLMRARLAKIVDAAALAGARAMAGATTFVDAVANATAAACDSAYVNGLKVGDCGTSGPKVTVSVGNVTNPDGSTQTGVIVTGTDTANTSFMALGTLIGCGSLCQTIDVSVQSQAAPDTLADVVLVLDDTGTMNCDGLPPSDCPIEQAKVGANALVDMLLADPNSHAKIAVVPFRGCYSTDSSRNQPTGYAGNGNPGNGCIILSSETQDLSNNTATLKTQINSRNGAGGYPGTNVCLGKHEGTTRLFGTGSRAIARKIMIVLTDGDNRYSDGAATDQRGNSPNPSGSFAPPLYVPSPSPQWSNDNSPASHDCRAQGITLDDTTSGANDDYDGRIRDLDIRTNSKATALKNPADPTQRVEIYVLRFADPPGDLSASTPCDPALVSSGNLSLNRLGSNDARDRNLARCIASNTSTAPPDPFSSAVNDHYFYAATPADINTQFQAIAKEILRKRRLVS